jgi:hypothetical protein
LSIRDIEAVQGWNDLDPQTREWIEAFEGPSLPLLADGRRAPCAPVAAPEQPLNARTADWWTVQEFPVRALLCARQRAAGTAPTPATAGAPARRLPQPEWRDVPDELDLASKVGVGVLLARGGEHFLS